MDYIEVWNTCGKRLSEATERYQDAETVSDYAVLRRDISCWIKDLPGDGIVTAVSLIELGGIRASCESRILELV